MEAQRCAQDPRARGCPRVVLLQIPLEIVGEVHAAVADETVLITASSGTITVDIPSLRVGLLALRGVGRRKQRSETISRANVVLQLTALSVQFRMAGGTVAILGSAVRPGWVSRFLGLAPLEIRLSGMFSLLKSLWQ
jgi:hypothetical protein